LRCPCSFVDLPRLTCAMRVYSLQNVHGTRTSPLLYRARASPLHRSSSVSLHLAAGPPPEISIPVAPSALSFFSVASRWCSMTLRFLKYVTCPRNQHESIVVQYNPVQSNPARKAIATFFSLIRSQPYVPSYLRMRSRTPSTPAHKHSSPSRLPARCR
jgi:hypothetical protein